MRYYYLATSLPSLEFGDQPTVDFASVLEAYKENLSKADLKQLDLLFMYFNLLNMKPLLRRLDLDPHASMNRVELEEILAQKSYFSDDILTALTHNEDPKVIAREFPRVLAYFFRDQIEEANGFLKEFFELEWHLRLVLAGYRAQRHKKDLVQEFKYEDLLDPFVANIIRQKDSSHFEAPTGFEQLIEVLMSAKQDPLQQHKLIEEFRFEKIREMVEGKEFSIDYLLAYLIMLKIIEDINLLDREKGIEVLNKVIRDTA